ncbi:MAG: hypothetical protein FJ033_05730 [Chloroflexi bacterium]|nr:hypothetical protein [Chloroflexota bacterium]
MVWVLRILIVLQLLVGLSLSRGLFGMRQLGAPSGEGDIHMLIGILLAIAAIAIVRPARGSVLGWIGRFSALVPLVIGLLVRFAGMTGVEVVLVHIVLGLVAFGLIEMAMAQSRRAAAATSASATPI